MAWTQAEIDALKSAIAQGVLSVKYADREVTYRSLREMRDTLALMQAEVTPTTRPKQFLLYAKKGL
jgi:hypothetical protein